MKLFKPSEIYDLDAYGDTIIEDFISIQRNIFREQKRIYEAFKTAKKFGVTNSTLRKELRARGIFGAMCRKFYPVKFDALPYSKTRFKNKLKDLKEMDRDKGFDKKRTINKRAFYPQSDLDRNLKIFKKSKTR